ncbi:MAG: S9 family peptidase [Actinobacteria bacterium]|nr:S9 family peptidase [Actinomycetota bacterium]
MTQRLSLTDDYHGRPVADPYRWLEDPATFPQEDREQWSQWQTDWGAAQSRTYQEVRDTWTTEESFEQSLQGLLAGGFQGLPTWRGQRQFFMRRSPGQQFAVLYTVDPDGEERVLIDPMTLDEQGTTTLDGYQPSWEGDRLAYLISVAGTEESELHVLDVTTGEELIAPIDRCRFSSIAWLPGGTQFYYVRRQAPDLVPQGEEQFHRRVRLHTVGRDPQEDPQVFGAGRLKTEYFGVSTTRNGRWLVVSASEGTAPRNDLFLGRLDATLTPDLATVVTGRDGNTAITIREDDRMYVWTDFEAPRGRLLVGHADQPSPEHWSPLLDEEPDSVLESFKLLDGPDGPEQYLVVARSRHSIGELSIHAASDGAALRRVETPGLGTLSGPTARPEGGSEFWYVYTDYATPPLVMRYDCLTDEQEVWARPPGSVEVPEVDARQVTYTSEDGTQVRMYVLSPAGPQKVRPTILYGYGGFGIPLAPAYNPEALAWVGAGGTYAFANLRGGGEEGEAWHRAGMLANKQNVFDDFHAAAEFLIGAGLTEPEQLCISGGSNGGLLVGAAVVQRPELYGAVICTAPLLDMIRYVTSQLGATWTVEYGDPAVEQEFEWLLAYSPYHNVSTAEYPAVLFSVFDNDTRTDPMHGRKMAAALQEAQRGEAPILLRTESDVGHGARSLNRAIAETAETLAFAAHYTGLQS